VTREWSVASIPASRCVACLVLIDGNVYHICIAGLEMDLPSMSSSMTVEP
jgi:hypothetical protein